MTNDRRRRGIVAWSACALVLIATIVTTVTVVLAAPVRAEIDGVVLTEDELAIGTDRVARAVEQAGGGEDEVRAAAIDALRDDLALFELGRELGVTDVERPADVLDALDEVNTERAAAQRAGEVVYGPVEYSPRTFYSKSLADVREAIIQTLRSSTDPRFHVDDADVRERFETESGEWTSAATTYTLTRAWTADSHAATAQPLLDDALRGGASQGVTVGTVSVTDAELVGGTWNPATADAIRGADVGAVAGLEPAESGWAMYRIDSRVVDTEAAYEHYRERIRGVLLEERLDEAIAALRADQRVSD